MRAPLRLLACCAVALGACGSAPTGIAIEVHGADATDANQLRVTGTFGDDGGWRAPAGMTLAPTGEDKRPFGAVEDVRVIVPDAWADRTVFVTVELLRDEQPARSRSGGAVVPAYEGGAVVVAGRTKRIRACFTGLACPPPGQ